MQANKNKAMFCQTGFRCDRLHAHSLIPVGICVFNMVVGQDPRGKKQEYKKLPPKWFKQWHIKHGDCIIYPLPCGKSEKQEHFTRAQSPHFLILPSLFAFYLLYSISDRNTNSKSYSSDVIGGIDPVTIDSSICSDNNHNDYEEAFSEESPSKKRKAYNLDMESLQEDGGE